MKTMILVVMLTTAILTGCTYPPVRPELSGSIATEFSQRKAPDLGGRIYVAMGIYKLPFSTVSQGWGSGELLINGTRVETVHNNPEFIVIDLQPGQYIFTWLLLAGSERLKASANPTVVTVQDGEVQFLALDVTEGMNWGAGRRHSSNACNGCKKRDHGKHA